MSKKIFVRGILSYFTQNNKRLPEILDEKGISFRLVSTLNDKAVLMVYLNTYLPSQDIQDLFGYTTDGEDYDISDSLDEEISDFDTTRYPYLIMVRLPYQVDESIKEALAESMSHMTNKLEVGYRTVEQGHTCVEIATDDTRRKGRVYRLLQKRGFQPDRTSEQIFQLA